MSSKMINPMNPWRLTIEQIQKIYTGEIRNWKEVGGNDATINPYIRNANSGSQEKRAKENQYRPKSYKELFTPEEAKKMDIGGHIDGPGDWKPDPNAAKRTKEFIEKGGNADPALDAIQDGDYHDLLDQNGGPEGF